MASLPIRYMVHSQNLSLFLLQQLITSYSINTRCVCITIILHHNKSLIHVLYTLHSIYCSYTLIHFAHCFDKSNSKTNKCNLFHPNCEYKQSPHAVRRKTQGYAGITKHTGKQTFSLEVQQRGNMRP